MDATELYRKAARRLYAEGSDDDIEIDDNAQVTFNNDNSGAFVQAWVWVPAYELRNQDAT